ncbi:beta strand repeat-containing protein, partial [Halomonas sp. B23F22_10]|uniref:beta strand repeat-containing protein n=1 Tax=Halomonas sp. B23F22_10 TaxID=3459515 RepID=UPI00373E377F
TYTITDADGDTSTATVSLTVEADSEPQLQIDTDPDAEGVQAGPDSVSEAGLSGGSSDPNDASETTDGTFAIDAGNDSLAATDGLVIVDKDGTGIDVTGGGTVQGNYGTLTVTLAGGVYSYSYTLDAAIDHADGAPDSESFAVTVTDQDGDKAHDTLTIDIADDEPIAMDDTDASIAEDTTTALTGNVLTNDTLGADRPAGVAFDNPQASYGTFIDSGDGTWSYALDNSNPAVQALGEGDSLTETFTYTLTDADGDESPASLTITISGADDRAAVVTAAATGPDGTVYEAGLTPDGSDAGSGSETTTGSFTISASDGIQNVVIGGTTFTLAQVQAFDGAQTVNTGEGTLSLDGYSGDSFGGTISYTYTLNATIDNDSKSVTGDDLVTLEHFDDSIAIQVNGVGGTTASDDLVIRAIDDAPVPSVTNAVSLNEIGVTVNGNLADIGADYPGSVTLSGTPPAGLTSGGKEISYQVSSGGALLTATAGGQVVFTLTAQQDGTYIFEQLQALDLAVLNSDLQSSVGASGPQPAYYIYEDATFGSDATGNWSVKITGNGNVNPSTQGMGIDNNLFQTSEVMRLEFDDEGASGAQNLAYVAKIGMNGLTGSESVSYTAYFTDGTSSTGVATSSSLVDGSLFITAPSGAYLDYVDLAAGTKTSLRVTSVSTFSLDEGEPKTLEFGYTATDADGDNVSGSLDITVQNSDLLSIDAGDNVLVGGAGSQVLSGGVGDDTLTGGLGADVFAWNLGDEGSSSTPAEDTVTDFTTGTFGTDANADKLDLSDLMAGMQDGEDLSSYIQSTDDGTNTTLHISTSGDMTSGDVSAADQIIQLQNVVTSVSDLQNNGQLDIE